jgi:DNA-binding transcriptional LysR family regulator
MNILDLDPRALRVLQGILEAQNISKAAASLRMAQPVAQAVLARMRRTLGDPLLVRGARGMVLTERARAIQPVIARILRDLQHLVEAPVGFDPSSVKQDIAIAAADYVQVSIMPPALEALHRLAPGLRMSLRSITPASYGEDLERGAVDLVLMPRGNAPQSLKSRVVSEERFVCIARIGHPRLKDGLDLDCYCALDHVLVSQINHDFLGQADKALSALGRQRRVRLAVSNFFAAIEFVRLSDAIATVPERIARRFQAELALYPPPIEVEGFTVALVWHERSHASPLYAWMRETIVRSVRQG